MVFGSSSNQGGIMEVYKILTMYVDVSGDMYIKWSEQAPDTFKMQMRASFGAMFKELPENTVIKNV